ncbi:MAG: MBL fold metallo-hydrolase [Chloroflexi bacterium]|nr:MBL fold metallo-hydrolase [Chloroflexota bacterium]
MEVIWYGHSCFRITERNKLSIITDPYGDSIGLPPLKLKADVVTVSHQEPGHNNINAVKGDPFLITSPGEYEIGGVFITALALHFVEQEIVRANVAYLFDYDNLTVLHLGDLAHIPDQSTIEALGQVNVLLLPVGGGNSLRAAQAAEVVALIEPNYIVPMHYALPGLKFQLDPVEKFLKAMGIGKAQESEALKVTAGELPEQSQVVVLLPQTK